MAFPLGKIFQLFLLFLFALICEAKKRPPLEIEPEFRVDEVSEQNALKFELDKCAFYSIIVLQASNVHFLDLKRPELAQNVTRRMVFFTKRYGFSGIFLKFDSDVLLTPGFEQFVELLGDEIKKEKKRSGMRKLRLILSISSNWVKYVYRRMPKFDAYFDAFYLWADEISSNSEFPIPSVAVPVDPLHNSELVPLKDSLARNAEHLAGSGVPRKKIIIGLSTWTRSYFIRKNEELKMPEVESLVYSNEDSGQTDGTLGYHEVCHLLDSKNKHQQLHYDNRSETTSLIIADQWYSFNEPEHAAFIHKLDWISNHEFGGIGLFSIQGDDPLNKCTRGLLPLHRTVGDRFKCRRGTKRGNLEQLGECTRLCFLDLEESRNSFAFEQLQPGWCSHMVIGQASVNPYVYSGPSKGMNLALKLYNDWERERKPFLIRHLLDEHNADGVELNCANGGLDGPNNAYQMNSFLADLRRTLGWKKQILVGFVDQLNFDFANMVRSVDYIVAIGYRYHRSTNTHTGHHSPLFKNSTLLNQPKMTIQGTLEELIYKKLIVSLSAEAMSQHFVEDIYGTRSWESRRIGESASSISQNRIRAHGPGVVSQTQTVWLSLQNIAGIALHGLEHDNIAGECPEGEPFHLLKTIAQSQTCYNCDVSSVKTNNKNTTKEIQNNSSELLENSDDEEGELTEEEKDLKAKKISNDQTLRCQQFDEFTTNFTVFCLLSLDNVEIDMLAKLPLKQCNVFLINNLAKLDEHGKTVENEKNKEKLEKIVSIANKKEKINLWGEVGCDMSQTQWERIINDRKREKTVAALNKLMTTYQLSGSATILTLEQAKIKSNLIIIELPTFAILQKREEEKAEPLIVTQKEVCQFIRKPGVQHHTRYDAVTSYWKTGEEWLSGENEQTIKYKVQYALQRRLGGVLLKSLESDDPEDFCKNGGYGGEERIIILFMKSATAKKAVKLLKAVKGESKVGDHGLEKFDKMRVNERNFQLVRNIHANWFATGLKALMGSLGRTLYQKLSKEEQKQLADCLYRVEDKMDLVLAANCLVNARRRHFARIITDQIGNNYKMRWKIKQQEHIDKLLGAYNMRMYDLVLGRDEPSMSQVEQESPQGLLKMGITLLNKLTQNGSNKTEATNFKFMSPRFAPLMPDGANKKSLFSPTIFALYENEENEEINGDKEGNLLKTADSLPKVLRASGLKSGDRQALLQMLMQLSGSIGHVKKAIELLKSLNFFEIEPDFREANKKIINAYKKVERSFDNEQKYDIDSRGWTFLDQRQFDQLCKEQHADFPEELRKETERFSQLDRIGREQALWKRIERIARNIPDEYADKLDERRRRKIEKLYRGKFRFKRQAGVEVGQPVILAPFMFTPTMGLSVLGPLILSPSIFAPQILAPSVLSPFVLSPGAPMPFILSPFVLGPFILSPMALTPFILTPYVLSPNILNPYALSPLILSPNVIFYIFL
uniref:Chitinase II domain-containing protein n=1 Tax=Meloidogyne javanica TaxID=6303 RepID=A0A915LHA5_MELJA